MKPIQALLFFLCLLSFSFVEGASAKSSDREKVLNLLAGEWVARSIYVATKLEIADHLEQGPQSIKQLAISTQTDPNSLRRVLRLLSEFGIFHEISENLYENTSSSTLLAKNSPNSLHALSLFYGEDIHKSWDHLLECMQTKIPAFELHYQKPVFQFFKENPSRAALFQQAMREKSSAVIQSSLTAFDFGKFRSVYDIGGGYGHFMAALLKKHTHLQGMVFELPEVVDSAIISSLKQEKRCQIHVGDFFISIPSGADAYLLKSVLHDWDDEKAALILDNCHRAMRDNSKLIIIEVVLQAKESRYASCMDFLMMAITGGKERTLDSFKRLLNSSGFALESIHSTDTEFSILEARKILVQKSVN